MHRTDRAGSRRLLLRATSLPLLVVMAAVLIACDGTTAEHGSADVSVTASGGSSAGGGTSVVTAAGSATDGIIVPESSGADAGAGGESGELGDDACDVAELWLAVSTQAGVSACWEASVMLEPDEQLGPLRGRVVLDEDGRVVDNTGLGVEENKQRWLDQWGDRRWPCLAGQTIGYECRNPN